VILTNTKLAKPDMKHAVVNALPTVIKIIPYPTWI